MLKKFSHIAAVLLITVSLFSCGTIVQNAEDPSGSGDRPDTSTEAETPLTETGSAAEAPTASSSAAVQPETQPFSIDIFFTEKNELPASYVIDGFETIMQEPELPTGCEVTALAEVLNYLGFDIDKVDLCDNFMPVDYEGAVNMYYAYIGDPKSSNGFGCYAPVIVKTAYEYFESVDSPCYAVDITGTDFKGVLFQVTQDRPVIVWTTMGQRETYPNYKWTAGNGEDMVFNDYQHCLAVYGYDFDEGVVYAADPLVGNTTYDLERFERIYDIMYKQAVVICGDSETKGCFTPDPEIENNEVWSRKKQLEEKTEVNVMDSVENND